MYKCLTCVKLYEIRDSHGGEYYFFGVLGFDAMYVG